MLDWYFYPLFSITISLSTDISQQTMSFKSWNLPSKNLLKQRISQSYPPTPITMSGQTNTCTSLSGIQWKIRVKYKWPPSQFVGWGLEISTLSIWYLMTIYRSYLNKVRNVSFRQNKERRKNVFKTINSISTCFKQPACRQDTTSPSIYLLCITVTSSERLPSSVCQSNCYKHNIVILQCLETNKHLPGGKIEL